MTKNTNQTDETVMRRWQVVAWSALFGLGVAVVAANNYRLNGADQVGVLTADLTTTQAERNAALREAKKHADELAAMRAEMDAAAAEVDRLLDEVGSCQISLGEAVDDVTELRGHFEVHHQQVRYLSSWLGWCRRDRKAAQCALGGEPECDNPTRVDFDGVVNK